MPVSRHRKINRAKKRPRIASASGAPAVAAHSRKNSNTKIIVIVLIVAVAAAAIAYLMVNRSEAGNEVTTASGMKYVDLKVGDGASPAIGQKVKVHYIGWLANGREFNNSYKGGAPAEFKLGDGLIPGWNEALQSMKVGGKRRIILPPALAYGPTGKPPTIPPNETLTFEIELLDVGGRS